MNHARALRLVSPGLRGALGPRPVVRLPPPCQHRAVSGIAGETGEAGPSKLSYPRYQPSPEYLPIIRVRELLGNRETSPKPAKDNKVVEVRGRLLKRQWVGKYLAFLELEEGRHRIQVMCDWSAIPYGPQKRDFKPYLDSLKRGDHVSVRGQPGKSEKGKTFLIRAEVLPQRYSHCLVAIPESYKDDETRVKKPHLDLIVNRKATDTLRLRAKILAGIRDYLDKSGFTEVQTPLLAAAAGGAIARPFRTLSTELPRRPLSLRIAPELWLKRLVIGGLERVYELGPAFRNEGVDATHNPEFTTCEFYAAFWTLEDLIGRTERLVHKLAVDASRYVTTDNLALDPINVDMHAPPYPRLEFIPTLEKALGFSLPPLSAETAAQDLATLLGEKSISLGDEPIADVPLPKMLDRLAAKYIEPLCCASPKPIFVVHHPECMAPLAKSFVCPATQQTVSARAELYVSGAEVANMYEEENDPAEQRAKLERQVALRASHADAVLDEGYLDALAAGLPPTGGWGCGVDRLVMHFAAAHKISEVLPFGNLRHVVGLYADDAGDAALRGGPAGAAEAASPNAAEAPPQARPEPHLPSPSKSPPSQGATAAPDRTKADSHGDETPLDIAGGGRKWVSSWQGGSPVEAVSAEPKKTG